MFEPGHILQVCPAIVKCFSVDVMANLVDWRIGDDSVHPDERDLTVVCDLAASIPFAPGLFSVPVNLFEDRQPFRITKSDEATLQRYSCDGGVGESWLTLDEHKNLRSQMSDVSLDDVG